MAVSELTCHEKAGHRLTLSLLNSTPRLGIFVQEPQEFDVHVFGINAAEAELMDPQQRILLLCATSAIKVQQHLAFHR